MMKDSIDAVKELALEEVYGTAVQLTTEQVEKVRGERPL